MYTMYALIVFMTKEIFMNTEKEMDDKIAIIDKKGCIVFPDDMIKKANQIITGKHKVNAMEQKIFNLSLAKVKFDDKLKRPVSVLSVPDIRKMLGCNGNSIYGHIRKIAHSLSDRKIIVEDKDNERFIIMNLISLVEYNRGKLTIKFEPESTKLIMNLQNNYTKLNLKSYSKLNNVYAMRLYEIFKSKLFKDVNSLIITYGINDLKLTIGMIQSNSEINDAIINGMSTELAVAKYYKGDELNITGNFKRALDTAVKEINTITDIYVEYNNIINNKTGKIEKIAFNVIDKSSLKNIKVNLDNNEQDKQLKENIPSENEIFELVYELKTVINELKATDVKQLLECANYDKNKVLEKYKLSKKVKNIDNLMAWMLSAIKNDYKTVETKADKKETNKFNDFEQRNYSDEQLEELEKKLLAK